MRRSSRVRGEEGPAAFPVFQKQGSVADLDASEDDALVYLGKRDKTPWLKPRKQGKYEMADAHWQGKSLKALAERTAEAVIEELPFGGSGSTTDRTIEFWLRSFFGDLVDLHTDKIRRAVTLATNLLGDDVHGDMRVLYGWTVLMALTSAR
jgi:hypothetical protein